MYYKYLMCKLEMHVKCTKQHSRFATTYLLTVTVHEMTLCISPLQRNGSQTSFTFFPESPGLLCRKNERKSSQLPGNFFQHGQAQRLATSSSAQLDTVNSNHCYLFGLPDELTVLFCPRSAFFDYCSEVFFFLLCTQIKLN